MFFLVEYDRAKCKTVFFERFVDADAERAQQARLAREIAINQAGADHEVVLLEASSEEILKRTHARYFEKIDELLDRVESSTSAFVVRERND